MATEAAVFREAASSATEVDGEGAVHQMREENIYLLVRGTYGTAPLKRYGGTLRCYRTLTENP